VKQVFKTLWRNIRRWLPGAIISIVALVAVFRLARWDDLVLAFTTIQPVNLSIAIVIIFISLGTRAMAWRVLLEYKTTVQKSFFVVCEGYFLNNILPLRAGEFARAIFMGRATGLGPFHVLSTIVLERAFDLAMAAGLLLATLPMALNLSWARPVAITTMALVIIGLITLYVIARNRHRVHDWILQLGKRWAFVQKWVVPQIDALLEGLGALTNPGRFLLSVFWIAMSWVLWVTMYYIMLLPLYPHMPYYMAMFTTGVLAMGIAIPAAPGGLGVYEASVVGALAIFGIKPAISLVYALLMHFLNFVITGVFGFIELVRSRASISQIFDGIQNPK